MARTLVVDDAERFVVEIMTIDDPTTGLDDECRDPFYATQCREPDCRWNCFADDGTLHVTEADAINDAEVHLDKHV